jgi:hypothetical protein
MNEAATRHSFLLPDSLLLDSPARAARRPHCPLANRQAGRSTMAAILTGVRKLSP